MRKCVATGEMKPKKELIRIVRSKEGEVSVDPIRKKSRAWCLFNIGSRNDYASEEEKYPGQSTKCGNRSFRL